MTLLGVLYVIVGAFAYFGQTGMIYHPTDRALTDCPLPAGVDIWRENGEQGLIAGMGNNQLVVFFHGNAGTACNWRFLGINHLAPIGYDVLVVEYPGYSNDPRTPSKRLILQAVDTAAAWIETQKYDRVIAMGYSLGTGAASYYAQNHPTDQVVLFAPFDSMYNVAWGQGLKYPRFLLSEDYNNLTTLANVDVPIHILHGEADQVIPASHSLNLFETLQANGANIHRETLPSAGHNGLFETPAFDQYLNRLLHN